MAKPSRSVLCKRSLFVPFLNWEQAGYSYHISDLKDRKIFAMSEKLVCFLLSEVENPHDWYIFPFALTARKLRAKFPASQDTYLSDRMTSPGSFTLCISCFVLEVNRM